MTWFYNNQVRIKNRQSNPFTTIDQILGDIWPSQAKGIQNRDLAGINLTFLGMKHDWLRNAGVDYLHIYAIVLLVLTRSSNRPVDTRQGRRNDVKARGADFRERALLNWYILRDVCKTSGVELRLIMFSIYWMIGVWGCSPPGDCAILEARWLHFLRFLKQIRKKNCTNIFDNSLFCQGNPLNWKGTFAPLAPPGKGCPSSPPPPVPASLTLVDLYFMCFILKTNVRILKAHSMSGGSIWASLECQCCFWIAGGWVVA
jgi:hypothetical protein